MSNNDTKSKDFEDKIKDSEIKYRTLFEHAADAIFLVDPENGDLVEFNNKAYEQLGYTREEFEKLKIPDFEIIESVEDVKEHIEKIFREGLDKFETKHRTKAGDIRNIYVSSKTMEIRGKTYIQSICRDITEKKRAEQKLKESEERLKKFMNSATEAFTLLDSNLNIIDNNEVAMKMFLSGVKKETIIGKNLADIAPDLKEKGRYNDLMNVIKTGEPFFADDATPHPKFGIRYVSFRAFKVGDGLGIISTDVSERKKAEEKILYQAQLVENVTDAILSFNMNYTILSWNKAAEKIYGWKAEEVIGKNFDEIIPVDFPYDNREDVLREFSEKGHWSGEGIQHHKNGTPLNILSSSAFFEDIEGNSIGLVTINRDITERKKAEQKLKESEEKYKYIANELEMILDHIPALVFFKDTENNFIRLNKYHADAHNLRKEDMQGVSCFNIYPKEQAQAYWDDDLEVVKTRKPKLNIIEPWDTPEGTRWALTSKIPYFDEQGKITGIIGLASDITERINAEEKLKESEANYRDAYEQAEFYKDLFAHDISNILQNIQSSLGLLSMWQNQPEKMNKISELMTIISDQLIRGSKLVANIRKLSEISEAESHIEPLDGLQILKDAKKFIHKSYPYKDLNIEVESEFEEVNIKANQLLLDVFENILFNSIKYNQNKKIDILTKISKEIKNGIKYVKIEFIDNGIGVPDVMKERIFKGISDRKEKIHGMGLGLLLVKRVLSIYNGDISVEDKVKGDPSQGSNFIILIPEVV